MDKEPVYPFKPGIAGIDFSAFRPPVSQTIISGSGRELKVNAERTSLSIVDVHNSHFCLQSEVNTNRFATFALYSRLGSQVHPDLFAGAFFRYALEHFPRWGMPVEAIVGTWSDGSANLIQFHKALAEGHNTYEAAMRTWTGTQARACGFEGIQYVVRGGHSEIIAKFIRG